MKAKITFSRKATAMYSIEIDTASNDPDEARAQIYWMIEKFYPDTNWDYELIDGAMVTKT